MATAALPVKLGKEVTLFSRHRKVLNRCFPGVVEALAALEADFVLDRRAGRAGKWLILLGVIADCASRYRMRKASLAFAVSDGLSPSILLETESFTLFKATKERTVTRQHLRRHLCLVSF